MAALLCLFLPALHLQGPVAVAPSEGGAGIQAALDAEGPGGAVVLSAGTYLINTPIILRFSNQSLTGVGDRTVLRLADNAQCPVVVLGSFSADKTHPVKGLRLAGLLIDGNRKQQAKEVWKVLPNGAGVYNNGVDVWGTDGATVENVTCCHCRSGGLVSTGGTRRMTVQNFSAFDSRFDGLACYMTEDSTFRHLNLHDNRAAGISMDLDFDHNVIDDATLTDDDLGIFMRQSSGNVFKGLVINKSHHHGVFMAETAAHTAAGWKMQPGSECVDNTFTDLLIAHSGGKAFIVNDAGCVRNAIWNWRFIDNAQGGLFQAAPGLVTMRRSLASGGAKTQPAHTVL